jgi:hypothetical protein
MANFTKVYLFQLLKSKRKLPGHVVPPALKLFFLFSAQPPGLQASKLPSLLLTIFTVFKLFNAFPLILTFFDRKKAKIGGF